MRLFSRQDALFMLEYCHEATSIRTLKAFKDMVFRLNELFRFTHSYYGYGNIEEWTTKKILTLS